MPKIIWHFINEIGCALSMNADIADVFFAEPLKLPVGNLAQDLWIPACSTLSPATTKALRQRENIRELQRPIDLAVGRQNLFQQG